jgi:hypothetical protein
MLPPVLDPVRAAGREGMREGMRFYIVCRGLYPDSRPWVLAETADEAYARDEADSWRTTFVVSREDALRIPRVREAVLAWDVRDDEAYREDMEREDAEAAFDDQPAEAEADAVEALGSTSEILTFRAFRELPTQAGQPDAMVHAAYVQYLRLEMAWDRTVDEPADP